MKRLIDADTLFRQIDSPYTEYPVIIQIRRAIKEMIDDAPTVDAEPVRHGHWINDFSSPLKCSSCGIVSKANEFTLRTDFKYCPYCGAKMDESTMGQVKPSDKEFTLYADDKPIVTFKNSKIVLHGERKEDELLVTDKD